MKNKTIVVLGGSGFVGTQLCARLQEEGYSLRVPSRRRERNRHLLVLPGLQLIDADIHDPSQLEVLFEGADVVINLVGILNEKANDGSGFRRAHVELADKVVAACKAKGVGRLLHMSALKADATAGTSHYLRTKGEAEDRVHTSGDSNFLVTSLRPSVIFGRDDDFINRFASLLKLPMLVFPLACPGSRFAPVYVGDVVEAFIYCLNQPSTAGQRYDLCGPTVYTLHQLVMYVRDRLGLCRWIWGLGGLHSKLQATLLNLVPGKPFSLDNYRSLQVDNICDACNHLQMMGISPVSLESVVPEYLSGRRQRSRYQLMRETARRL